MVRLRARPYLGGSRHLQGICVLLQGGENIGHVLHGGDDHRALPGQALFIGGGPGLAVFQGAACEDRPGDTAGQTPAAAAGHSGLAVTVTLPLLGA
jgi:hypothetical protein